MFNFVTNSKSCRECWNLPIARLCQLHPLMPLAWMLSSKALPALKIRNGYFLCHWVTGLSFDQIRENQQKERKWDKESLIFYETSLKNHSAAVCFVMSAMVATVQVKQYPPSLTWPQIFTSPSCLLIAKKVPSLTRLSLYRGDDRCPETTATTQIHPVISETGGTCAGFHTDGECLLPEVE